jgi:hypothetical protein
MTGERLNLWSYLAGAYAGEVCLRAYGGEWIDHGGESAISISGLTGFPFSTAHRLLSGEESKSLAFFAQAIASLR